MKKSKKIHAFLAAVLLVATSASSISSSAYVPRFKEFSEDTRFVTYDGLQYAIEGDRAKIIGATDTSVTSVTIPAEIEGLPVEYPYFNCFQDCPNLTEILVDPENKELKSIDGVLFRKDMDSLCIYPCAREGDVYVLPDGISTIETNAFSCCTNIKEITMPSNVYIGNKAFEDSSLETFTNPILMRTGGGIDGCRQLKELNWADSSGMNLPPKLIGLTLDRFQNLESLIVPENYTSVDAYVLLSNCPNLKQVVLPSGDYGQGIILRNCKNLESFSMSASTISEKFHLYGCDKITSLDLSDITIDRSGLDFGFYVENCATLEDVQLPDAIDYEIVNCPNISSLSFDSERIPYLKLGDGNTNLKDLYFYNKDVRSGNIKVLDSESTNSFQDLADMDITIHCRRASKDLQEMCEKYGIPYMILEDEVTLGDTTGDGELDIRDVIMTNRIYVGVEKSKPSRILGGDFDGNKKLDLSDSMRILRKLVGLDDEIKLN
ncbi:MAG: leucine-rich repeat protein [Oscillospiraceae bacterium]|nr:leucine-rich repeat protein [Oscillospiraceae bacterium]